MAKENNEEMQITPDLDQAMREGQPTFDGEHSNDVAAAPLIPGNPGPDDNMGEEAAETAAKKDGEISEEITDRTKKEDTPPDAGFRFRDHPEAEKGYRELQGKATKAEQRAAAAEAELNRVRDAEKIKAAAEATRATIVDFAANRRAQALEEIDALDPDDKEYRKKAATVLSQADIDIYDHYQTHGRTAPAAARPEPAAREEDAATREVETVTRYVQERIVAEGFGADDPLFWQYASRAPIADAQGKPTSLDTQIQWAMSQTKQYHDSIRTKLKSEEENRVAEEVRKRQITSLPLGRGTPGGASTPGGSAVSQSASPVSLADAIDFAQDRRRL